MRPRLFLRHQPRATSTSNVSHEEQGTQSIGKGEGNGERGTGNGIHGKWERKRKFEMKVRASSS